MEHLLGFQPSPVQAHDVEHTDPRPVDAGLSPTHAGRLGDVRGNERRLGRGHAEFYRRIASAEQPGSAVANRLYSERMARIHRTSFEEQRAAFDYFRRHADKKYSTVDCLSFVVMDNPGIREALA